MQELALTFASDKNPLVIHNIRLANPLDEYAKALKRLNAKRKKTEDDYLDISRTEWEGGLYFDDEAGPYLPTSYPSRVLLEAAKITRNGTDLKRAVLVSSMEDSNRIPVEYDGPRDVEGMWEDERYRDVRMVKVGMSKVLRTRPRFEDWSISFKVLLDERILETEVFEEIAHRAGRNIGIGEAAEGGRARFEVKCEVREAVIA